MSTPLARTREDVLAPIAAAFEEAAPDGGGAKFVARYFRHVPIDALTSRTPDIYAGAAASHLELARHRMPGVANVRVFTPTIDDHGWSTGHTVIEIVTDDMPFLVDSVSAELARQAADALHLSCTPSWWCAGTLRDAGRPSWAPTGERSGEGSPRTRSPESWMLVEIDRESATGGAGAASPPTVARARRRAGRRRGLAEDARGRAARRRRAGGDPAAHLRPTGRRRRAHASWTGWPTATSRSSATASTPSSDRTARTPWHRPGTGLGVLRDDPAAGARASPARRGRPAPKLREPHAAHPTKANSRSTVHRPVPRLHRGQAVRRRRQGRGGAALPRPLHLHAYTASVHEMPVSAQVRRRCSTAPASHRTATPARTSSRSSRPTRATSSSRSASTSSTRPRRRSCTCRSAAAPGSSCAATTSAASSPAWSTSRATATTPTVRLRMEEILRTPSAATRRLHDPGQRVGARPAALRRAACPGRRLRTRRRRARARAPGRRHAHVGDDLADALRAEHGEEEAATALDRYGARLPRRPTRRLLPTHGGRRPRPSSARTTATARARRSTAADAAPDDLRRFKLYRAATRCP